MMAHMLSNKKRNPTVTKLFINRGKKIKHSSCFYYAILFFCTKKYAKPYT